MRRTMRMTDLLLGVMGALAAASLPAGCAKKDAAEKPPGERGATPERTAARAEARKGALEFRIVSEERYVTPAVEAFAQEDPRFAHRVIVVSTPGIDRIEADDREGSPGTQVLREFLDAWRTSPALQADPVAAALWSRVFIGQPDRGRPEGAPATWQTWLLEPEAFITGDHVTKAEVHLDPDDFRNPATVLAEFDASGTEQLAAATGEHVGRRMAIVVDGIVKSAPMIIEAITGGKVRITLGLGSSMELAAEADDLVRALGFGGP